MLSEIVQLKERRSDLLTVLECFEPILRVQKETEESFVPEFSGLGFSVCQKRHGEGKPFLSSATVTIPWDQFDDLAFRICTITNSFAHNKEVPFKESWHALEKNGKDWHSTLLQGFFDNPAQLKKLTKNTPVEYDFLYFIAVHTFTPFIEKYAEKLREYIDSNVWLKGTCPVCGKEPLMGQLDKETGKKHLQCHLCRTNWEFGRLECAFCGNTDQEKLRYFFDEEDTVHRVEVCDGCRAYLKIVDMRNMIDDTTLVVENLATLHLDIVAKREGFFRDTNRLFGI